VAKKIVLGALLLLAVDFHVIGQSSYSVLHSGKWAKLAVTEDAIYKIDYNLLKASGFDVDNLDPRSIALLGSENGMLPQANNTPQPRLTELAIYVEGEADGIFNQGDYILFFGQGPDAHHFISEKEIFYYENHLYTDENFYFLTVSAGDGKRLSIQANESGTFPVVNTFNDFLFYETEKYNELKSGRQWFGEQFDATTEMTIKFDVPGYLPGSNIKIVSSVMAQSFNGSSFNLSLNGSNVVGQPIAAIPNTQYGVKGRVVTDTVVVNSVSAAPLEFRYQYVKSSSGKSIGYLNFLIAAIERSLALYGSHTFFQSSTSLLNPISTFEVSSMPANGMIWDVTDPFNCKLQSFQLSDDKAIFSTVTDELKIFVANALTNLPLPSLKGNVVNQNLVGGIADLIIVTAPEFKEEALRLASHRQSKQGLDVKVVTTTEVYNEFSGGKQDPTAIRNYVRSMYNEGWLKNLLLFGRCSYDYKDRVLNNTNFVPTYESRNSLSPLETYSSDDYFSFLEETEGNWSENPSQGHTMDIGVGRLPVATVAEAKVVVDKLISYDNNQKAFGPWRKQIAFVADDGDFNLHQSDADKLATDIETDHFSFNTKKIYLDAFPQISKPSGQESPAARKALKEATRQGTLIVNFTGHGSEKVWLQEQILDEDFIDEWENEIEYPLLVTATCEFGRHDDPAINSSSILALSKEKGGTIGLVTASRPVSAFTNATLNKAFYEALLTKSNGKYKDLGTVFRETKNNSLNGVSNRNFSLLADPSMKLAIPDKTIEVTQLNTNSGSDTLKALSHVVLQGEVWSNGILDADFSGTMTATLSDKEFEYTTLGDESAAFTYKERTNDLFRGKATVANGIFEMTFIMPKNLAYQIGNGKLSLYAHENNFESDAIGGKVDFKIGGSEPNAPEDNTPPEIHLFMGDTTFIYGSQVSSTTQLVALLYDNSGINITNYGIGNNLVAILDGDEEFELSDYYISGKDNYRNGTIIFPMDGLVPGKHSLEVRAWDVYNNPASAVIEFVVTRDDGLMIESLANYPNPFSDLTTIEFTHNRTGEDLEAFLEIYNPNGQRMKTSTYQVPSSQFRVTLDEWDGTNTFGTKLNNGIYLLRLTVRSLVDGSKNGLITKVIILN
jgi:hypothetical protein